MDKVNKGIKALAVVISFMLLFVGTAKLLRFILTDDTSSYTRVTYHEMYEQDNIDVLFVGSSHSYRNFNPGILDQELKQNTFNAGSSLQPMDSSLMVIKEALKYNDIRHIYLEIYFGCAFDIKKQRKQATSTYIVSDYLKPSLDKYLYLLKATNKDHYMNSFIIARRDWRKIFDFNYIKDLIEKKMSVPYRTYDYSVLYGDTVILPGASEWYEGKGYVANSGVVNNWDFFSTSGWEPLLTENISEDWVKDLETIIELCDERDIPLTLIGAPMSDFLVTSVEHYDDYISFIKKIIKGKNVDYYDFNLCKETYFPSVSELYKDADHLNCYGADQFCFLFADLVNGVISEDELFYSSYLEKQDNLPARIYGVSYHDTKTEDGSVKRFCKIVSNRDDLEYTVTIQPDFKKPYSIHHDTKDKYFELDPNEKGRCVITYRLDEDPQKAYEISLTLPSTI